MSHSTNTPTVDSNGAASATRHLRALYLLGGSVRRLAFSLITTVKHRGWGRSLNPFALPYVRQLRSGRRLIRVVVLGWIALITSGIGHTLFHPVRNPSPEAALTVASLGGGYSVLDTVPGTFEGELGYQPVAAGGTLLNPNGGCSTPGGIGPGSFDDACRVHDFGYDLLRYAERTDSRLGASARFQLDQHLYTDLLRVCTTVTCRATATAYYTGVTLNSIRQGYAAPTSEPIVPWTGLAVAVIGLGVIPPGPSRGCGCGRDHPEWVNGRTDIVAEAGFGQLSRPGATTDGLGSHEDKDLPAAAAETRCCGQSVGTRPDDFRIRVAQCLFPAEFRLSLLHERRSRLEEIIGKEVGTVPMGDVIECFFDRPTPVGLKNPLHSSENQR